MSTYAENFTDTIFAISRNYDFMQLSLQVMATNSKFT